MIDIVEYMSRSQEDRQKHLDLSQPCDERGGRSYYFRGLLAHHLGTSIPSGIGTQLCHACHNGGCSNVAHLYWGTPSENRQDAAQDPKRKPYSKPKNHKGFTPGNQHGVKGGSQLKSGIHKERISKAGKNKLNFTNGSANIRLNKGEIPPEGFYRGMTRRKALVVQPVEACDSKS